MENKTIFTVRELNELLQEIQKAIKAHPDANHLPFWKKVFEEAIETLIAEKMEKLDFATIFTAQEIEAFNKILFARKLSGVDRRPQSRYGGNPNTAAGRHMIEQKHRLY